MIFLEQADAAAELLALGLSERETAVRTGISRGTVAAIASGRWHSLYADRARRMAEQGREEPPRGPTATCGGCGRLIQLPCLACRAEARAASACVTSTEPRTERQNAKRVQNCPPSMLALKPEDHARYLTVRRSADDDSRGCRARPAEASIERETKPIRPPKLSAHKREPSIRDVLDAFEIDG